MRERVQRSEYLLSLHADEERRNDGLGLADIERTLLAGRVLEDYPDDPRGASCLVYGESGSGPVHVVCGANRSGWLVVITVYRPSAPKWKTPTERGS